jgi:predicted peptidase
MKTLPGYVVGIGLLFGCVIAGALFAKQPDRPAAAAPEAGGRYRLFGRDRDELILIDTANGKCWLYRGYDDRKKRPEWVDLETPAGRR